MGPTARPAGARRSARLRLLGAAVAAAAALTACGGGDSGGSSPTTATSSPAAGSTAPSSPEPASPTPGVAPATLVARCGEDRNLTQPLPVPFTFTTADGVTLLGAEFGTGARGVVALHELGSAGLCGWSAYAQYLAAKGLHVLVFDHRCVGLSTCPDGKAGGDLLADTAAARAELIRRGATTTALLGASQGGGEAIAAAGTQPGWTRAAVLSGALFTLDFGGGVTSTAAMPKVTIPLLFYVAKDDPDSPLAADQTIVASAPAGVATLEVLEPGGHGWSLLQPFPGDAFTTTAAEVATFLSS